MNWLKRQRSTPTPEALVDAILDSIMTGPDAEIEEAFMALDGLDAVEVIAELFLRIEDLTDGVELDALIDATEIPLPDHPREIVEAIRSRDMKALKAVMSTDDLNLVVSRVMNLIVAFTDAGRPL